MIKLLFKICLLVTFALPVLVKASETSSSINIQAPKDADIFAEYTDSLPAVLNYFTKHNEDEIIKFYQQIYGEVISRTVKKGRLTVEFNDDNNIVRVIISTQSNKQQVDIIIK